MTCLNETELKSALQRVPGWNLDGLEIERTYEFRDFPSALAFVVHIGTLAERADHHPDIDIRWNRVRLALSTHSAGGLTVKDFDLAAASDRVAEGYA
jgi:4a-hydroxytetrahydrobiopterin dehydratase